MADAKLSFPSLGAAYSAEHYRPILDVLLRHRHVWLMVDDMYEHVVYGDFQFATPAALAARNLTTNGVSKAYAITGWRIRHAGGPTTLIKAIAVVQSQSMSCPSSVSQATAAEALTGPQHILAVRRDSFRERRDAVVVALSNIARIRCRLPEGAFYTYASVEGLMGRKTPDGAAIEDDSDLASYLLRDANVAVIPGSAFGLSPYFRISCATSMEELVEACRRISVTVSNLR